MPDTLALWHSEHVNFARLLNLLDDQVSLFHDGTDADYELMLDIMFYMTHYSDVLHHPKEDLIFARIKTRDATMAKTIDALAQQHTRLKAAGEALVRHLDDIINGSIEPRAAVEAAARDYVDTLRAHIRIEETEVLPVAGRLLTVQDWQAVHAAIGRVEDPLFGKHPQGRYAALQVRIARDAKAAPQPGAGAA